MAQLQHMDAHLDTLSIELYQVNIRVSRNARRQAVIDGFISETSPPPTLEAEDEDDDDDATASKDDNDGDASSSSADEMST